MAGPGSSRFENTAKILPVAPRRLLTKNVAAMAQPFYAEIRSDVVRRADECGVNLAPGDLFAYGQQQAVQARVRWIYPRIYNPDAPHVRMAEQRPAPDLAHIAVAKDKAVHAKVFWAAASLACLANKGWTTASSERLRRPIAARKRNIDASSTGAM